MTVHGTEAPSAWLQRWSHLIPAQSRILDVACGGGRHMQWLAAQGHQAIGVDRAPEALALASQWGETLLADIEKGPWPLPDQTFGAVVVTNYLWRPLWPQILGSMAPGGVLLYETFAQGNETVGKPSRPDFLLRPGELLEVCTQTGLRIIAFEEGFLDAPQRFIQRIAAVREKPADQPMRWPLA